MSVVSELHQLTYPKIETLYVRDTATFQVTDELRLPEFGLVNRWLVTEKVDGTNVRVFWDGERVSFGGRSNNAQMPIPLLTVLQELFPPHMLAATFPDLDEGSQAILFGEGYGAKIQKAGGNYRATPHFRLFDVRVGDWWLNWPDVQDVARDLGIATVPALGVDLTLDEARAWVEAPSSVAAAEGGLASFVHEGIVARTDPLLFTRRGGRVMWKLKGSDFRAGRR